MSFLGAIAAGIVLGAIFSVRGRRSGLVDGTADWKRVRRAGRTS
jgi:hypothetical protein